MRRVWASALLVLLVAACGSDQLSLSEYNKQGMVIVTAMEERIYALDAEWESHTPTVEGARSYWDRRVKARVDAIEGLETLKAPDELADLLGAGLGLFIELTDAEKALAVRVASFETATEPHQWWDTAEGKAVLALDEEVNAYCRIVQARYDETIDRIILSDVPWMPSDMKEIVQVDIGCEG